MPPGFIYPPLQCLAALSWAGGIVLLLIGINHDRPALWENGIWAIIVGFIFAALWDIGTRSVRIEENQKKIIEKLNQK